MFFFFTCVFCINQQLKRASIFFLFHSLFNVFFFFYQSLIEQNIIQEEVLMSLFSLTANCCAVWLSQSLTLQSSGINGELANVKRENLRLLTSVALCHMSSSPSVDFPPHCALKLFFPQDVCSSPWILIGWWNAGIFHLDLHSSPPPPPPPRPLPFYSTFLPLQSPMLHGLLGNYANNCISERSRHWRSNKTIPWNSSHHFGPLLST